MASLFCIARPYAKAAFDYAKSRRELANWEAFLNNVALAARQPRMQRLISNLNLSVKELVEFFNIALDGQYTLAQKNFLHILAQNKRLAALPEIANLFSQLYSELEKITSVRLITAITLEEKLKQKFSEALAKSIKNEVTLQCEIDPAILGGAIIHIGDRVIDGSVRGKLTRLLEFSLR